jgi:hypothetical protein
MLLPAGEVGVKEMVDTILIYDISDIKYQIMSSNLLKTQKYDMRMHWIIKTVDFSLICDISHIKYQKPTLTAVLSLSGGYDELNTGKF